MKKRNEIKEFEFLVEEFKKDTGKEVWTHLKLAEYAMAKGYQAPTPKTPTELLARKFSSLARQSTKIDECSGVPYRTYQSVRDPYDSKGQGLLWVETNKADREMMLGAKTLRREQVIGDLFQLNADVDHWNRIHPDEERIVVDNNFEPDVQERMAGYSDEDSGEQVCDDDDLEEI